MAHFCLAKTMQQKLVLSHSFWHSFWAFLNCWHLLGFGIEMIEFISCPFLVYPKNTRQINFINFHLNFIRFFSFRKIFEQPNNWFHAFFSISSISSLAQPKAFWALIDWLELINFIMIWLVANWSSQLLQLSVFSLNCPWLCNIQFKIYFIIKSFSYHPFLKRQLLEKWKTFKRCEYLPTAVPRRQNTISPQHPSVEMKKLVNIRGESLLSGTSQEEIREKHFIQLSNLWEGKFGNGKRRGSKWRTKKWNL